MQTYLQQREALLRLDEVDDPRDPRGRRWSLTAMLSSALLSMALLARSLRRAEQLTEDLAGSRLLRRLGIRRRVPDTTLGTKPTVIIHDLVRLALVGAQAEIRIQVLDIKEEFGRLGLRAPQAETDTGRPDG